MRFINWLIPFCRHLFVLPVELDLSNTVNRFSDMLHITRKMHVLCFVLPSYIRSGQIYKYLKIEHQIENLHQMWNEFERQYANIPNRPHRWYLSLKAYENKIKTDISEF